MPPSEHNSPNAQPNNLPRIQASELAQYGFCHRAWRLSTVKKLRPDDEANLVRGQRIHARHERQVRGAKRWRQMGFLFIGTGGLFLLFIIVWLWAGSL